MASGSKRIQAVLYHHGVAQPRDLLRAGRREWLERVEVCAAAREKITIALSVIDPLDAQSRR